MDIQFQKCILVAESQTQFGAKNDKLTNSDLVRDFAIDCLKLTEEPDEYFYMICLSNKLKVIGVHQVSHGNIDSTIVSPREVFKRAVVNNASALIFIHNHPSGEIEPSREDLNLTKKLLQCGQLLDIKIIEHLIIGGLNGDIYSMKKEGDLDQMTFEIN